MFVASLTVLLMFGVAVMVLIAAVAFMGFHTDSARAHLRRALLHVVISVFRRFVLVGVAILSDRRTGGL